jgi:hypothetical protein
LLDSQQQQKNKDNNKQLQQDITNSTQQIGASVINTTEIGMMM